MARRWKNTWIVTSIAELDGWDAWALSYRPRRPKHRMRARRMRDQQWQRAHAWVTAFLAESSNRSI